MGVELKLEDTACARLVRQLFPIHEDIWLSKSQGRFLYFCGKTCTTKKLSVFCLLLLNFISI